MPQLHAEFAQRCPHRALKFQGLRRMCNQIRRRPEPWFGSVRSLGEDRSRASITLGRESRPPEKYVSYSRQLPFPDDDENPAPSRYLKRARSGQCAKGNLTRAFPPPIKQNCQL